MFSSFLFHLFWWFCCALIRVIAPCDCGCLSPCKGWVIIISMVLFRVLKLVLLHGCYTQSGLQAYRSVRSPIPPKLRFGICMIKFKTQYRSFGSQPCTIDTTIVYSILAHIAQRPIVAHERGLEDMCWLRHHSSYAVTLAISSENKQCYHQKF
jgi:hypothetical protein